MRLAPGEVHVWSAAVPSLGRRLGLFESWLDPGEKQQACRYHFERERRRYGACRGLLRMLSGGYLGLAPERLVYRKGKSGKPALAAPWESLRFNLSHSGDRILLAFSMGREVGIDLERMRPEVAAETIAQACFSARDQAELAAAGERKTPTFFRLWTRLEAGLKLGGGSLAQWQEDARRFSADAGVLQEARVYELNTQPGYAAALAVGPLERGAAGSTEPLIRHFEL